MLNDASLPVLPPGNLKQVLENIRNARPLGTTPLKRFAVVEQLLDPVTLVDRSIGLDVIIIRWLSDLITEQLRQQRQYFGLPYPTLETMRQQALQDFAADFRQQAPELESWSALYFRYVRVELQISWQEMEDATLQEARTLRRRQERAIERLTRQIIALESAARNQARTALLQQSIPPLPWPRLLGRSAFLEQGQQWLNTMSQRHLLITGPGGIGKTALAVTLTHTLIEARTLDIVIWLQISEDDAFENLLPRVAVALGLPSQNVDRINVYCQSKDVLIVFDEAEWLVNDLTALRTTLRYTAKARLLLISRFEPALLLLPVMRLPELNQDSAATIVSQSWQGKYPLTLELRNYIWHQAGGNPLAIKLATKLVASLPAPGVEDIPSLSTATDLEGYYETAWGLLSDFERRIWMTVWLLPGNLAAHDLVLKVGRAAPEQIAAAVRTLNRLSLLGITPDGQYYDLHSIARAYLRHKAGQSDEILAWLEEASRRLIAILEQSPTPARLAEHLFLLSTVVRLSLAQRVEITTKAWLGVAKQGRWLDWRSILKTQVAIADEQRDHDAHAFFALHLGVVHRWLGHYSDAEAILLTCLQKHGERQSAAVLVELAVVYRYQQHYAQAVEAAGQALQWFQASGDVENQRRCTLELAQIMLEQGHPWEALSHLENIPPSARVLALACEANLLLHNYQEALALVERVQVLAQDDYPNLARTQGMAGKVYFSLGHLREAENHYLIALSLFERVRDMFGWSRAATGLARVYDMDNDFTQAMHYLEDAEAHQRLIGDSLGLYTTLRTRITVQLKLAERAEHDDDADEAATQVESLRELGEELKTLQEALADDSSADFWI